MNDNFDLVNLYKHYSKNILKESRISLTEKEVIKKFPNEFKKFRVVLYYDDDPNMIPASFQIDYVYGIVFNTRAIAEDFSEEQIDFGPDITTDVIPDDEIDKLISKKLKGGETKQKVSKAPEVDITGFYHDFFKKNLPNYVISNKLNDLIRAGTLPIEGWKVYAVTYSTQVDDKLLFRKIEDGFKKKKSSIVSPYGYQIAFESANKQQRYGLKEVMEFTKEFSKALETSLLKDTKYYKIAKK
jgi:hypothetical protein